MTVAYFFKCGFIDGEDVLMELLYVLTITELAVITDFVLISDAEGRGEIGANPLLTKGGCNIFK